MNNCRDCIFVKCLLRNDDDFVICPVEKKKQEQTENKYDETKG